MDITVCYLFWFYSISFKTTHNPSFWDPWRYLLCFHELQTINQLTAEPFFFSLSQTHHTAALQIVDGMCQPRGQSPRPSSITFYNYGGEQLSRSNFPIQLKVTFKRETSECIRMKLLLWLLLKVWQLFLILSLLPVRWSVNLTKSTSATHKPQQQKWDAHTIVHILSACLINSSIGHNPGTFSEIAYFTLFHSTQSVDKR